MSHPSGQNIFNYNKLSSIFSNASQVASFKEETFEFSPYIHYYPKNDAPDTASLDDFSLKIPYISSYDINKLYNPYP